jgi:nucleoside-diphosphate-sugar epimerase
MKILVTGATGFIGRHLAERLCAEGHEVRGLVRDPSKASAIRRWGVEVVCGDVTDSTSVRKAMQDVEVVFHLASRVTDWGSWSEFESATVQGTENVLSAAADAGVRRFVHMSTVGVYDDQCTRKCRIVPETTPQGSQGDRTLGFYARAKVLAEAAVWRYSHERGLAVVVLRPALVYGPQDETTMPRLIDYLSGAGAMWVGRRNSTVDPIYVSDVVGCAVAAARSDAAVGQAYNVAPSEQWGVRDFWRLLCRELGLREPKWTIPASLVMVAAVICEKVARLFGRRQPPTLTRAGVALFAMDRHHDPSKAIRELGWRPQISLKEGIRLTVRSMSLPMRSDSVPSLAPAYRAPQAVCG